MAEQLTLNDLSVGHIGKLVTIWHDHQAIGGRVIGFSVTPPEGLWSEVDSVKVEFKFATYHGKPCHRMEVLE